MRYVYSLIFLLLLSSCSTKRSQSNPVVTTTPSEITQTDLSQAAIGQTIYVPVYSHIYYENKQKSLNLAATLSIRNTDSNNPIFITAVRYYGSEGQLIQQYLEQPIKLAPLASTDFVVARTDTSGGSGANFIVEWVAMKVVIEPIVEAIMISAEIGQGISFISPGKVIKIDRQPIKKIAKPDITS